MARRDVYWGQASPLRRLLFSLLGILTLTGLLGCGKDQVAKTKAVSDVPEVDGCQAEVRTIIRNVGQPSFIESFEQTAIYAKLPGYVLKWNVDIGDRLKKGQELATLFIPELVQELEQKKAMVQQEEQLVEQAKKLVAVADANLRAAEAMVKKPGPTSGSRKRWWPAGIPRSAGSSSMVKERVVDKQILAESERQLQSNAGFPGRGRGSGRHGLPPSGLRRRPTSTKPGVDVAVAQRLRVATADLGRVQALIGYLTLTAPYDGIVVARNANVGDFVLPATGDPSAAPRSTDQSAAKATPIYVVARTDLVRVFVDVAGSDANNIVCRTDKEAGDKRPITKGQVHVYSLDNIDIAAEATRAAWALNFKSRTLRTEIDLPNPGARLLPGMYAYGTLVIDRPGVLAVPATCVVEIGNQFGCWLLADGKSAWTPVRTGVSDGKWMECQQKQVDGKWSSFDGSEQVITSNVSELSNGKAVQVASPPTPAAH